MKRSTTFPLLCAAMLMLFFQSPAVGAVGKKPGPTTAPISAQLNFKSLPPGQQAVLAVVIDVPEGLHAQSNKPLDENLIALSVMLDENPAIQAFEPIYPAAEEHTYPMLGKLSVYTGRVIVFVPLQVKSDAAQGPIRITGKIQYQMCNDKACFQPQRPTFFIETSIVPPGTPLEANAAELFAGFDFSQFARLIKTPADRGATGGGAAGKGVTGGIGRAPKMALFGIELTQNWQYFIAALLIGMIFNVMPCVLPVLPLKAMSFYEVSQHQRGKSIALGLVFSLGIVAVFAVLGLLVVVLRKLEWGQLFGNVWFLGLIVAVLAVLSFQLFGLFNVILPPGVYRFSPRHDTYSGNFLFGIFTAILSTPCTFGLFLGLLIWATAQPAAIGLSLLITVGIGMALPYIVLSATPELARRFPRTGPWSELTKQMMGFLLLASAVFFARRFIVGFSGEHAFWWMLFGVVAIAGAFLIVRSIQLSSRLMPRLIGIAIALLTVAPALAFTLRQTNPPIAWQPYTAEAVAAARAQGKIVILEFTAAWCGNCLALETTVFHDPKIAAAFTQHAVVPFRVDLTDESAPGWKALSELSTVGAIPLTAVFSPNLPEPIKLAGLYSKSDLLDALDRAAKPRAAAEILSGSTAIR